MAADWKIKFYDKTVERIRSGVTKNITAAGRAYMAELKQVLSVPGRTTTYRTTKSGKTVKLRGAKGSSPSAPGEAPHKQTGKLVRSMRGKLVRSATAYRVTLKGAVSREYGTKKMAERPSLRPTLAKMKSSLAR